MEKILIVYYSRTGNTKKVAEILQQNLGCDIEEIVPLKSFAGAIGWILAGKEGSQRIHGKIKPNPNGATKNPADYDLVVVGTPIWMWNMASPVRGYLAMNKEKIKKIAAFCTMGSDEGRVFEEIEKICGKTLQARATFIDKDILSGKIEIKNFLSNK